MSNVRSLIDGYWDRFDEALTNKNISKNELARRVGCDRKTLYRSSGATPNALYLARICVQLDVSADYLLGIKKEMK